MASKPDPQTENKRWVLYALFVAVIAWLALWSVTQLPVGGLTKVLFFVALFFAITGTLMPAIAYLNARFGSASPGMYRFRFIRQSGQIGFMAVIIAWLQMLRVLDWTLALIVIGVFALIETFLITRESPGS
ncbi:MAG: hypothetical protein JW934_14870 [Anaerolineae bacterium]|nr:hypothetical protein [Anaerolineae bacterium]